MSEYAEDLRLQIANGVGKSVEDLPLKGFHIVVDAGNGAGGFYATKVLQPLGADVSGSVFLEPDGYFPNHIPNPEDAVAMASIQKAVVDNHADLGVIFDTDVDRAGCVDETAWKSTVIGWWPWLRCWRWKVTIRARWLPIRLLQMG